MPDMVHQAIEGTGHKEFVKEQKSGADISNTNVISDFDLYIAKQRVHNILKKTVENNELVACLPILIRSNGKVLKVLSVEKKENVNFVKDVCMKFYENRRRSQSSSNKTHMSKRKSTSHKTMPKDKERTVSEKEVSVGVNKKSHPYTKVRPVLSEAISIFLNFKCVNLRKREIIHKYGLHDNAFKFISYMDILTDIAAELLFQSEKELREKAGEMAKAARYSKMLQTVINELLVKVDNLKKESSKQLAQKNVLLEKLQNKKDLIDFEYRRQLKDIWVSSTYGMVEARTDSFERSEELKSNLKSIAETYSTLCSNNLSTEKKLKNKCNKVEAQLASWLAKYDSDVGEKRMEYEKLQEQLDEVDSAIDDLENNLADLDPQYLKFKEEEDEEIQEKFNEMAYKFLLNRSAMTIQRYWRAYRLEKKSKKKGKGGKKGKGKK